MVKESLIEGVGLIDEVKLYRADKVLRLASKLRGDKLPDIITPELAVDIFYSFYYPIPVVKEATKSIEQGDQAESFRASVVSSLVSNVNLWKVKPYTVADSLTSVVAAASFVERLASAMTSMTQRTAQGSRKGKGEGERKGEGARDNVSSEKIMEAVNKALEEAERNSKTAKSLKQVMSRVGAGRSSILEFDESAEMVMRLARETDISRILEKVEGIKFSVSKSKRVQRYSKGWLEGVEYGNDLERVHHSQIALPDDYFLASLANSKLLLYQKVLQATRGPLYVLLDKSGSMVGTKIDWARAVAVALFKKAVEESRIFYARFFDSMVYNPIMLRPRSKPSDILKLLSYLARVKAGGGTDITRAAAIAAEDLVNLRTGRDRINDVVLITDGEDRISIDQMNRIIKRGKFRLHSVMVMGHNPYLQKVSYRYLAVKKLEESEALKVIEFSS